MPCRALLPAGKISTIGGLDDFNSNYRFLAKYNWWINQRLHGACGSMHDEERKRGHGALFGSIHNTLNHLIVGAQIWPWRFAQ